MIRRNFLQRVVATVAAWCGVKTAEALPSKVATGQRLRGFDGEAGEPGYASDGADLLKPLYRRVTRDDAAACPAMPVHWYGRHGWQRTQWRDVRKGWTLLEVDHYCDRPIINIFTAVSNAKICSMPTYIGVDIAGQHDLVFEWEKRQLLADKLTRDQLVESVQNYEQAFGGPPTVLRLGPDALVHLLRSGVLELCAARGRACFPVTGWPDVLGCLVVFDVQLWGYRFERADMETLAIWSPQATGYWALGKAADDARGATTLMELGDGD